jgi:hypothetical protein
MQLGLTLLAIGGALIYLALRFNPFSKVKQKAGCEKCGEVTIRKEQNNL